MDLKLSGLLLLLKVFRIGTTSFPCVVLHYLSAELSSRGINNYLVRRVIVEGYVTASPLALLSVRRAKQNAVLAHDRRALKALDPLDPCGSLLGRRAEARFLLFSTLHCWRCFC